MVMFPLVRGHSVTSATQSGTPGACRGWNSEIAVIADLGYTILFLLVLLSRSSTNSVSILWIRFTMKEGIEPIMSYERGDA